MYGGRWNSQGVEVVYAASTPSLSALEVLANYRFLPLDFGLTEIEIPDTVPYRSLLRLPKAAELFPKLHSFEKERLRLEHPFTQKHGDAWVKMGKTAILTVPSAIVPVDYNYVINPNHADFHKITFYPPIPFKFDPRLKSVNTV